MYVCMYVYMNVMVMQTTLPLMDQLHILHNHVFSYWRWPMGIESLINLLEAIMVNFHLQIVK